MQRSFLFVPAANQKAMVKAGQLGADALILDLEDGLAPPEKDMGRAAVIRFLRKRKDVPCPVLVRINANGSPLGQADIRAICTEQPGALVVPKVETAQHLQAVHDQMRAALAGTQKPIPALWAMIETPAGLLNLAAICRQGKALGLVGLIAGTNDLVHELRCANSPTRTPILAHLGQIILHARAFGLSALDGVFNDFSNADGFAKQARQGRAMGFDGKTLIHPSQIAPANLAFGPSANAIKQAKAIVRAFSYKKNAGKGAINISGQMFERMHLEAAHRLLAQLATENPTT